VRNARKRVRHILMVLAQHCNLQRTAAALALVQAGSGQRGCVLQRINRRSPFTYVPSKLSSAPGSTPSAQCSMTPGGRKLT
jgi:hypothetical protein